jgi:hypothetical protein
MGYRTEAVIESVLATRDSSAKSNKEKDATEFEAVLRGMERRAGIQGLPLSGAE